MTVNVGSCFSGIGGFELGLQWAFDNAGIDHKVSWQIEQNPFCQTILKKHWPKAVLYSDIREVKKVDPVDILLGGFPCQDISVAGLQKGVVNGEKSNLWFEMLRIIGDIRPRIVVLENVPNIVNVGGPRVIGSLAKIGYDCEWSLISAAQFGAPHIRKRWFCIATNAQSFSNDRRINRRLFKKESSRKSQHAQTGNSVKDAADTISKYAQIPSKRKHPSQPQSGSNGQNRQVIPNWRNWPTQPAFCGRNDGVPNRVAKLKALGNAIVPQCAQFVFEQIIESGILESQQTT